MTSNVGSFCLHVPSCWDYGNILPSLVVFGAETRTKALRMQASSLPKGSLLQSCLEFLHNPDSQHTQEGKDAGLEKATKESPSLTGHVREGIFLAPWTESSAHPRIFLNTSKERSRGPKPRWKPTYTFLMLSACWLALLASQTMQSDSASSFLFDS